MKKLMLGNEAAARGLYEAGCALISSYPGTPSTEITERAAQYDEIYCEWAPNEKVAMEVAFGAALAARDLHLDRSSLLTTVWGEGYFGDDKIVDVNVRRLRMKIEPEPSNPKYLTTVWGFGYKWVE